MTITSVGLSIEKPEGKRFTANETSAPIQNKEHSLSCSRRCLLLKPEIQHIKEQERFHKVRSVSRTYKKFLDYLSCGCWNNNGILQVIRLCLPFGTCRAKGSRDCMRYKVSPSVLKGAACICPPGTLQEMHVLRCPEPIPGKCLSKNHETCVCRFTGVQNPISSQ